MTCKSIKKFLNLCSDVYKTQNFGGIIEKKVWILSNIFLSKEFPQRKVVIVPHLRGGGPSTMYHLKLTLFCRRPCGLKGNISISGLCFDIMLFSPHYPTSPWYSKMELGNTEVA